MDNVENVENVENERTITILLEKDTLPAVVRVRDAMTTANDASAVQIAIVAGIADPDKHIWLDETVADNALSVAAGA